ncbi:MAG: ABC transporter ATP-binding protein [Synergistaceae bacterium]|nr:ABC transporter ATP-binding protein [Synergistaceae bacterium]
MSKITFKNITKFYGKTQVIKEFNGEFDDGKFITLLGPSGCGKTTMLRMIAGFEKPTGGEILIDDKLVSGGDNFVPPNERNIGMVFQSYAVWPHMNVFNNVAYPLKIQGLSKDAIKIKVEQVLEAVHLSPYINRMPDELSGGQQQRVALGRALVSSPKVLLLDEPLSNLDAKLRESMRFEIKEVQRKFNITVVYVTHDQTEAMAMSDKIIIFNQGEVQQADTPENIYKHPANQFTADFIGKINFIHGQVDNNKIKILNSNQAINYSGDKTGDIVLGIRPENIKIFKFNSAGLDLDNNKNILTGELKHSYYLGDINDLRIELEGCGEIIRVTESGNNFNNFQPGDKVILEFEDYLVFIDAK